MSTTWYLPDRQFFKVLGAGRHPSQGIGRWPEPGIWTPTRKPVLCVSGWHLCRPDDLIQFLHYGPHIWMAESHPDATVVHGDNKVVVSRARLLHEVETWTECTARLFAADCAEHVLPHFETRCPNDDRPRHAIETARRFANGEATRQELAAAGYAAQSAAWYAESAAGYAAESAAGYAARYAGSAAGYAAGSAAESAGYAARYAGSAAGYAAGSAAQPVDLDRSWMDDGACKGMDQDIFFTGRGESTAPAKAVCAGCPVRQACLDYALAAGEKFGTWGALSERERRRIRTAARRAAA